MIKVTSELLEQIQTQQKVDEYLQEKRELMKHRKTTEFDENTDGIVRLKGRICVPNDKMTKNLILEEVHKSKLSIHPGATKMYQDLKKIY